ncbi:MAG: DMT family transporter [Deltaproteobacteria bacterium]|nr:DMT family transporter [Deltaproteobacteria bacterium]
MNVVLFMFLTVVWGSAYVAIHMVIQHYPPIFAAALRVGLGLLILLGIAWRAIFRARIGASERWWGLLTGVLIMGVAWSALFWGQQYIAPAIAAIVIAATPTLTALMLPLFDRAAIVRGRQWGGVVTGFVGILFVFSPQWLQQPTGELKGLSAVLLTAVAYAVATCLLQTRLHRVPGRPTFFWQSLGALLFLLAVSAGLESWPPPRTLLQVTDVNLILLYLGLFPSTLAFLIALHLIRVWGGVATMSVTFTAPLVALLIDAVWLRQIPAWPVLIGAVIIFFGTYLVHDPARRPPIIRRNVCSNAL